MNNNDGGQVQEAVKKSFFTELKFTEVYKQYINAHPAIREAMCLKAEYPDYFTGIRENDLIAGRIEHGLVGFSPDEWGPTAFGYYCRAEVITELLEKEDYPGEEREKISDMVEFWRTESTSAKLRAAYPEIMAKYLPDDDWMNKSGISFPLYRLTGGNVDNGKLLALGIPGLRKLLEDYISNATQWQR